MIDLSHPIRTGMTVFPGDPDVALAEALTIAHDGVRVTGITMGSHTGTHLDAPSHTVQGGREINEIALDELAGEALVLRVSDARAGQALTANDLGLESLTRVPAMVAIHTGWDQHFGTPTYLSHPFLTKDAAQRLCELGMHVLVIDTLNPDQTADSSGPAAQHDTFPVHEVVLGSDRLIVENVRGLDLVPDHFTLGIFPLRLAHGDGAPVRAVALSSVHD